MKVTLVFPSGVGLAGRGLGFRVSTKIPKSLGFRKTGKEWRYTAASPAKRTQAMSVVGWRNSAAELALLLHKIGYFSKKLTVADRVEPARGADGALVARPVAVQAAAASAHVVDRERAHRVVAWNAGRGAGWARHSPRAARAGVAARQVRVPS